MITAGPRGLRPHPSMAQPAAMRWSGALEPQTAFVVLALVFGVAMVVATPPLDAPDEPRHLQRAWLLSEGRVLVPGAQRGEGGAFPVSLTRLHVPYTRGTSGCRHETDELRRWLHVPLEPGRRMDEIRTPIPYGPVGYLAQAAVMALGRGLGLGAGALFYLARFANLLAATAITAFAIGIAPSRRWTLVAVALLPMALFEASTLSSDAITNALSLCLLALVLRATAAPESASSVLPVLSRRERVALLGVIVLLGLGKLGYSLLALCVLAIPAARFADLREQRVFVLLALVLGAAVPLAWWASVFAMGPFPYPGADPPAQLTGLLHAPWRLVPVVAASLATGAVDYGLELIGVLGRLDVVLPMWIYAGYAGLVVVVALADTDTAPALSRRARAVLAATATLGCLVVFVLLYVGASAPGAARVTGIQGRYFLPFLAVAAAAAPRMRSIGLRGSWLVAGWCAVGLAASLLAIGNRYYGG